MVIHISSGGIFEGKAVGLNRRHHLVMMYILQVHVSTIERERVC